jgi:hypothetical protein
LAHRWNVDQAIDIPAAATVKNYQLTRCNVTEQFMV